MLLKDGANYKGVRYTENGIPFLYYEYPYDISSKKGVESAAFYIDDNKKCFAYRLHYISQRFIERVVKEIQDDPFIKKDANAFKWTNGFWHFSVDIGLSSGDTFNVEYRMVEAPVIKPIAIDSVYLCMGNNYTVYHKTQTCNGLRKCSTTLKKVSLYDAINTYHRKLCGDEK